MDHHGRILEDVQDPLRRSVKLIHCVYVLGEGVIPPSTGFPSLTVSAVVVVSQGGGG